MKWNFQEHIFHRTLPSDCFFNNKISNIKPTMRKKFQIKRIAGAPDEYLSLITLPNNVQQIVKSLKHLAINL